MAQIDLNPSLGSYLDQANAAQGETATAGILPVGEPNSVSNDILRSLVKFDLSSIPANATITSASLILTVTSDLSSNARTLSAYRVLRNWASGANWNTYNSTNNWGTAGCGNTTTDREATDIGTATQPASPSAGSTVTISLTASKIQEWYSGALANYGLLLKVDTEVDDAIYYESGNSTNKPILRIDYTVPGGASGSFQFI